MMRAQENFRTCPPSSGLAATVAAASATPISTMNRVAMELATHMPAKAAAAMTASSSRLGPAPPAWTASLARRR
jgi:hypothetical protein